MPSREFLGDRKHTQEEEYFRRKERELVAKLQEQGRRDKERSGIKDRLGIADEQLVTNLQEAGFAPDTLSLLHLVPLVEVSWAEGEVSARERELILGLAAGRGIAPDTEAHRQLTSWLDRCPDAQFFETAYEAIRATLARQDPESRKATERDLVDWSTRIAEATGGLLGLFPVSRDERECIRRITDRLTEKQRGVAHERLKTGDS